MNTPDYTALARQFMDMWQQQMQQAMTEPGFVNAMMDTMGTTKKQASYEQNPAKDKQPSATSESSDEQLDELTRRIRTLERRVAELEKPRAKDVEKPHKKPAKRTAKTAIRKRAVKPTDKPKRSTSATKKPAAKRATKRT